VHTFKVSAHYTRTNGIDRVYGSLVLWRVMQGEITKLIWDRATVIHCKASITHEEEDIYLTQINNNHGNSTPIVPTRRSTMLATHADTVVSAYSVNRHKHQLTFPVLGLVDESAERFVGVQINYQGDWNCRYTIARVTKPPLTAEYRLTMAYLITLRFSLVV